MLSSTSMDQPRQLDSLLPKMHLGSFSAMTDVGDYFNNVGRTPPSSSPPQLPHQPSDPSSSSGGSIGPGVAGVGAGGGGYGSAGLPDANRAWRQQQSSSPPNPSARRRSAQSNQSVSNDPPRRSSPTATRVDTDQVAAAAFVYPFATTALATSIEAANENPYASLPPGASNPRFRNGKGGSTQPVIVTSPSRTASRSSASPSIQQQQQRSMIVESPVQATMSISSSATAFNSPPKGSPQNVQQDTLNSDFETVRSKTSPTQGNATRSPTGSPQYPQQRPELSSPSQQQQNAIGGLPPSSPRQQSGPSSFQPVASPTRPLNQSSPYPSFPSIQQASQAQVVQQQMPQQRRPMNVAQVEEVCIECMMRDRDMADVDVTGDKVWERESDIWYEELVSKDREDEVNARMAGVDLTTYLAQQQRLAEAKGEEQTKPRPRAQGGFLTEENVKVWLTMNPKEPQARWQTLQAYVTSQGALLAAEARARSEAIRESKLMDTKLRDTYAQIRRSAYEAGATHVPPVEEGPSPGTGVRVKAPRSVSGSGWAPSPAMGGKRDLTLLENGLIVERVDVKREEREERQRLKKEEKQWRRMSSSGGLSGSYSMPNGGDVHSMYSNGAPSPTTETSQLYLPYSQSAGNFPVPPSSPGMMSSNTSMRRLSTTSLVQGLNPPRPMHRYASPQASVETAGPGVVKRFFGYKNWGNASQASLAISGSVANMHVELDQERNAHLIQNPPHDRSAPASLEYVNDPWGPQVVHQGNGVVSDNEAHTVQSSTSGGNKSKKKNSGGGRGFGKLWKIMTGQSRGGHGGSHADDASMSYREKASIMASQEDDLSAPLAPPPPLTYIISNRSDRSPHSRHLSGSSGPPPNGAAAPSISGVSPPTAPSSLLPSPTSNRFTGRDSSVGSDDRDRRSSAAIRDDVEVDLDTSEGGVRRSAYGGNGYDQGSLLKVPNRPPSTASFNTMPSTNSTPRPFSMEKTLPPLPHELQHQNQGQRPNTFHVGGPTPDFNGVSPPTGGPFRGPGEGMRRQSFSGMTGRLNSQAQQVWSKTLGPAGGYGLKQDAQNGPGTDQYGALMPPVPVGARYDEFGGSRMSLGKYEDVRGFESYGEDGGNKRSHKTKSKFGFGSLFGSKKNHQPQQPSFDQQFYQQHAYPQHPQDPNSYPQNMSHASFYDAGFVNGNPDLRKSAAGNRSSIISSKSKMVGLVTQDEDFVAYRYPSAEQALSPYR